MLWAFLSFSTSNLTGLKSPIYDFCLATEIRLTGCRCYLHHGLETERHRDAGPNARN